MMRDRKAAGFHLCIIRFYDHENTRLLQIDMTEEHHEDIDMPCTA